MQKKTHLCQLWSYFNNIQSFSFMHVPNISAKNVSRLKNSQQLSDMCQRILQHGSFTYCSVGNLQFFKTGESKTRFWVTSTQPYNFIWQPQWDLRSSGTLCSTGVVIPHRRFGTAYWSNLHGLIIEYGTNKLSRNVSTELPLYAA